MDDWDLSLPPGQPRRSFDWRSFLSVFLGWQVASLVGAVAVSMGMSIVSEGGIGAGFFAALFAWIFTSPALLVRGVMRFDWGIPAAAAAGGAYGAFMMMVLESLIAGSDSVLDDHLGATLAVYVGAGAMAGAAWWLTERPLRAT